MKINGRCPYLVIVGATATGKTSVAIKLAKKISGEIISADSRQIYKYLTVGTAKPQGYDIPYHLVDFLEPKEKFSAGEFVRLAEEFIEKIAARGKQPIIVGGTGLYIKTLIDGIVRLPSADEKLRQKLHKLVETRGKKHLHMLLKKFDPASAEKIHPNNTVRIIRALEVYYLTGKPISHWHKIHPSPLPLPQRREEESILNPLPQGERNKVRGFKIFGLEWQRDVLYERINNRVNWMLDNGMIEETRKLIKKGYQKDCPALQSLGYKWVLDYLENKIDYNKMQQLIMRDTRHYAKRQRTWFKKDKRINWIKLKEPFKSDRVADDIWKKFYLLV